MREIVINSKKHGQKIVLVDDEDFEFLNQWNWHLKPARNTFYATRQQFDGHSNFKHVKMHRLILGLNDSKIKGDHKDRNGLNNQRANLRICNPSENNCNQKSHKGSTSKYRGVSWCTERKKWVAHIQKEKKLVHIGRFFTEKEAALAYNNMAKELHGDFANLNKI